MGFMYDNSNHGLDRTAARWPQKNPSSCMTIRWPQKNPSSCMTVRCKKRIYDCSYGWSSRTTM